MVAAAVAEAPVEPAVAALPVRSWTSGSWVTEPASGRASPWGSAGLEAYGKLSPLWTVRTASGSLRSRKDSQTLVPSSTPYLDWAAISESALLTSPPPPEPNSEPTTEASATRSVILKWSMVPALVIESLCPVRTYSPGK